MLVFAVPFNSKHINPAFLKAFESMSRILARHKVHLIIIDCRYDDNEHLSSKVESIMRWIDGIIFPGNPYSIDPRLYGEVPIHPKRIDPEPKNFSFVKSMIEMAQAKKIPILGICAGSWYLNVARGGTLKQEIAHFSSEVNHDADPRDGRVTHGINIVPSTRLFSIFKSTEARVNSWHDQAIGALGKGLRASAYAPDGVIEAIEMADDDSFFVGIAFHPEYLLKGEVDHQYLSPSDISKQQSIFSDMAMAATHRPPCHAEVPEIKLRALAYHEANTERLIHSAEHHGKLQLR